MIPITEEQGIHKEWYKEAQDMTVENLPAFIKKLTTEYHYDYGTICHAITSAAIAAAWAVERSPQGGITGFQAGCIMWEFIKNWMRYDEQPMRLLQFEYLLFPQYAHLFTQINPSIWEWVQKEAAKKLAEGTKTLEGDVVLTHPNVVAHWQSIVDGNVPFGLKVGDE